MYKNIEKKQIMKLEDLVEYQEGQVVSKTLVQNVLVSVTVLDGKGKFTIGGEEYILQKGETIVMPKNVPHAVYGEEKFKMLLVVSF